MSYTRILIHLVFSTKDRIPYLTKYIRHYIKKHIHKNCNEKGIVIIALNGHYDHLHCLLSLGKQQSISKIAMLIKGESSHWINRNMPPDQQFYWQDEYYAASISEADLEKVKNDILNHDQLHSNITFDEELAEFSGKNNFKVAL